MVLQKVYVHSPDVFKLTYTSVSNQAQYKFFITKETQSNPLLNKTQLQLVIPQVNIAPGTNNSSSLYALYSNSSL